MLFVAEHHAVLEEFDLVIIRFIVFLAENFALLFLSKHDVVRTWSDSLNNDLKKFVRQRSLKSYLSEENLAEIFRWRLFVLGRCAEIKSGVFEWNDGFGRCETIHKELDLRLASFFFLALVFR